MAVGYSLVVSVLIYREIDARALLEVIKRSAISSAVVMFIVSMAGVFSFVLTRAGVPAMIGAWLVETFTSPVKIIVGPLSAKFIKINKDLLKSIAKSCIPCEGPDGETEGDGNDDSRKKNGAKIKEYVTAKNWEKIYLYRCYINNLFYFRVSSILMIMKDI